MRKIALAGSMVALAAVLACGCAGTQTVAKNETADRAADQPDLVQRTEWPAVQASYEALQGQADELAASIGGDGATVRKQVYDIADEICENLPTAVEAGVSGNIDAAAEKALQTIYIDGVALESLGDQDTTDVGLYISDMGHDAQWLVANVYYGDKLNIDLAQSEVKENYYDKIMSFDEDRDHDKNPVENETQKQHWDEFASRIS